MTFMLDWALNIKCLPVCLTQIHPALTFMLDCGLNIIIIIIVIIIIIIIDLFSKAQFPPKHNFKLNALYIS